MNRRKLLILPVILFVMVTIFFVVRILYSNRETVTDQYSGWLEYQVYWPHWPFRSLEHIYRDGRLYPHDIDIDFYIACDERKTYTRRACPSFEYRDWFPLWAELNDVRGVSYVGILWDCSCANAHNFDIYDCIVSLNLFLSHEFTAYMKSDRGEQLVEALANTYAWHPRIEFTLSILSP